jgi:hypothetical protein
MRRRLARPAPRGRILWIVAAVAGFALVAVPAWPTSVVAGTPWGGSQDQGGGTPGAGDTNRVDIVFDPSKSELTTPCEEIVLIQTVQMCANGIPVDPGVYYDGFEYRDDDAIDDQPDTSGDETGTYVDHLEDASTPYYQASAGGPGSVGSSNGTSSNSSLVDAPATGGGNRGFDGLQTVKYKFETCAFCAKGEDAGHYFGCLLWEYTKTGADQAAGTPGTSTFTGTSNQPSPGFQAAVDQWAANHDFDLPRG